MGYQALLFCPDEKLARIVAQVFTELEFNVETVQEPFSAVKKLMAQRYAALVVDCENESNASLLFKSARNSSSNQGILAIAVVEGQAGVAKAYRIGANLVLTKPINVEQAKGTLRVARGLLRKSSERATAASSQPAPRTDAVAASPTRTPMIETSSAAAAPMPSSAAAEIPEAEPALPAMAATVADAAVAAPVQTAVVQEVPATAAVPEAAPLLAAPEVNAMLSALPAPAAISASATVGQGAAVAPAKVKEFLAVDTKPVEVAPAETTHVVFPPQETEPVGSTPSFSALEPESESASGGSKKILIAAIVVLAVAALGYFGWTKFGPQSVVATPARPVSTVQPSSPVPAPAPAPVDRSAMDALKADAPKSVPAATQPATTAPAVTSSANAKASSAAVPRIEIDSPAETKTPSVAPLVVKSKPNKKSKTADDAPEPGPLAVGETNTSALSNLVGTSGATPTQVSLATLKISQGVSQGLLIKRVDPKYPPSALAMHVQGAVILDATINREGQISNLKVLKGDQVLARAATDAVKQWRYKPYYLDGQPVEIETQITVNFKLPN